VKKKKKSFSFFCFFHIMLQSNEANEILGTPSRKRGRSLTGDAKSPSALPAQQAKKLPPRPKGMSREVYMLTLGAPGVRPMVDTLVPTKPVRAYKKRRNMNLRVTPWLWRDFENPARKDGVKFKHWSRADQKHVGYGPAKFNLPLHIVEYTDREYQRFLLDSRWSKDDTDLLFSLAKQFDLRWPIVYDRFNQVKRESKRGDDTKLLEHAGRKAKQVVQAALDDDDDGEKDDDEAELEQAKQDVQAALDDDGEKDDEIERVESSIEVIDSCHSLTSMKERFYGAVRVLLELRGVAPGSKVDAALASFRYDRGRDELRRKQLRLLYEQTKAEADEQASVVKDHQTIETTMRKIDRERETAITAARQALVMPMFDESSYGSTLPHIGLRCDVIVPKPFAPRTARGPIGTALRSARVWTPVQLGAKLSQRVDAAVAELGVDLRPMPTDLVVEIFNHLRDDVVVLLDLHATLYKREQQLHILRQRLFDLQRQQEQQKERRKKPK
jgi:SANT/Myb-like domain of DAMP1/DNA methyltransferase 1-associated protein 1 (DMAP1)